MALADGLCEGGMLLLTDVVSATSSPGRGRRSRLSDSKRCCNRSRRHGSSGSPRHQSSRYWARRYSDLLSNEESAAIFAEYALGVHFVEVGNGSIGVDNEAAGIAWRSLAIDEVPDFQFGVGLEASDTNPRNRGGTNGTRVNVEEREETSLSRDGNCCRRGSRGGCHGCRLRHQASSAATHGGIGSDCNGLADCISGGKGLGD